MQAYIGISPGHRSLIFNRQMACKQSSARCADSFNLPVIGSLRGDNQPELASLLPPPGNILQASYPDRQRSSTGKGEQQIEGMFTWDSAFWVQIERVEATKITNALHHPAPDTSNLKGI